LAGTEGRSRPTPGDHYFCSGEDAFPRLRPREGGFAGAGLCGIVGSGEEGGGPPRLRRRRGFTGSTGYKILIH